MWFGKVLPSPLPGEHVVLYLRRHWLTFIIEVFKYLVLLFLPVLLFWFMITYTPERMEQIFNGEVTEMLVKMGLGIYYLGVWVFFWTVWVDYYLDVWLVTNERIISIEQKGLFNRSRNELRMGRIEDVTTEVKGVLATVFHFGNITIQTAGMEQNSIFKSVPNAYQVAETVLKTTNGWRRIHNIHDSTNTTNTPV